MDYQSAIMVKLRIMKKPAKCYLGNNWSKDMEKLSSKFGISIGGTN
jgi:hypothetical protein